MLRTRVMPCLLLRGRALVTTRRFRDAAYVGDPVNTVRIFNEKEVDELILLDITATPEGNEPNFDLIEELASECFMPIAYGGGLQRLDQIERVFAAGVEKVVLNTAAHTGDDLLEQAAAEFGSQSIVVSIDVGKTWWGRETVYVNGGRDATKLDPESAARRVADLGAGEILAMSIDRDGEMDGYHLDVTRRIAEAVSIPVVASGGAGSLAHLVEAVDAGASAVAAGSLFVYQGSNRSVLINFPKREQLEVLFSESPAVRAA